MQRHVANGGYPHDDAGKNIVQTCEEILKLSDFGRKVRNSTLNDNAHTIAERAGEKLKQLRQHMESLGKQGYYEAWRQSFAPDDGDSLIELDSATMESYKDAFTINQFDEALSDMFPLLHSIMQETGEVDLENYVGEVQDDEEDENAVKEDIFAEFEGWAESVVNESFSDDELKGLEELVQEPLMVGANEEAVQALMGVGINDPALINALRAIASMPNGADADARDTIKAFLGADASKISWGDMESGTPKPTAQPQPETDNMEEPQDTGMEDPEMDSNPQSAIPPEPAMTQESIDLSQWTPDAAHRVASSKIADWTELHAELVNDLGLDSVKADKIAKRLYYHGAINPHGEQGDDDSFVASLRNKAKPKEDSLETDPENKLIEPESSPTGKIKDVAQSIMGFYDRQQGTWTKGEHGVVTHVKRQFSDDNGNGGEKEAALAAQLIQHINQRFEATNTFEDIRRLAGLSIPKKN